MTVLNDCTSGQETVAGKIDFIEGEYRFIPDMGVLSYGEGILGDIRKKLKELNNGKV